jgi:hypothetical protein
VERTQNGFQFIDLRNYIGEAKMRDGVKFLDCPFYIILFGNADMVEEYMNHFKRVMPPNDSTIKYLLFDPYPDNDDGPPKSQDLNSDPVKPELSEEFQKYTLDLPDSDEALNFIFSPPLSGISGSEFSKTQLEWDFYISEDKVPFWRIWNEGITDTSGDFVLPFEVAPNVSIHPEDIVIHYFAVDPKNGSTIAGTDSNNLYINIGKPYEENNSVKVPLKLLQKKLTLNSPVMFLFEVPLTKQISAAQYTELDYINDTNVNWYKDWTLNLQDYYINAYTILERRDGVKYPWFWLDGHLDPIKENGTFYRSSTKTLNLDKLIENIFKDRQLFIKTNNIPQINSDIHQYATFGFVVRQKYRNKEYLKEGNEGNPDDDDFYDNNGHYAFSDNEITELLNRQNQ